MSKISEAQRKYFVSRVTSKMNNVIANLKQQNAAEVTKDAELNLDEYLKTVKVFDDLESLKMFSELIKNGMAWSLQGHYGRTAKHLIDNEYLLDNGDINEGKLEDIGIL